MNEPIRVLHVEMGMIRAGIETMIMNYYRNIDRDRVQFDFAGYKTEECDYDNEIRCLGGRIYYYPRYTLINYGMFVKWWDNFFEQHPEYKIVHSHAEGTYDIVLKIAKKHGCFTIAHSHSSRGIELPTPKSILFHISSIKVRNTADFFFGCSKNAIIDKFGNKIYNDANRSKIINNAIDISNYRYNQLIREEARKELKISDDTLVVGTVGRIERQKNPFFICKIIEELSKRKINYIFIWLGTGKMESRVKKKLEDFKNSVMFLGVKGNVDYYLQAMDVFILPSLWEGLSVASIEAQASGTPVLLSESCSHEVNVTDICKFLSLKNVGPWCDEIVKCFHKVKKDTSKQVEEAGYGILKESKELALFYERRIV